MLGDYDTTSKYSKFEMRKSDKSLYNGLARKDTITMLMDDETLGLNEKQRRNRIYKNLLNSIFELIIIVSSLAIIINYGKNLNFFEQRRDKEDQ